MTEVEFAKHTRDLIQHALACSFTIFTARQRDIALQLREAAHTRVTELEAAEKEAEKPERLVSAIENPDTPKLTQKILEAVGLLTHDLCIANTKIDRLGTRFDDFRDLMASHEHCNGTSGQCYYPDTPATEGEQCDSTKS